MIRVDGFKRPYNISISKDGYIACLTEGLKTKLYIFYNGKLYHSSSIDSLGISECSHLAFNNHNEIAFIDEKKHRLCLYNIALRKVASIQLPGKKYGTIYYDGTNNNYYISILDLSQIISISYPNFSIDVYYNYSNIQDCKSVNGIVIIDDRIILLDKDQSAVYEIIRNQNDYTFNRYLKYGRNGHGNTRIPSDIIKYCNQIVIVDKNNYLIQYFDLHMEFSGQLGGKGPGNNQFDLPVSACEYMNDIYICDKNNDRIVRVDNNKNFSVEISTKFMKGHLRRPSGVSVGMNGDIFVTDRSNNSIQIFDNKFNFIKLLGGVNITLNRPSSICLYNTDDNEIVFAVIERKLGYNSSLKYYKTNEGYDFLDNYMVFNESILNDPQDMDMSKSGIIHVADTLNRRIIQINLSGHIINQVDMKKISNNERILIKTICVRDDDHVFTADFDECVIYEFNNKLKIVNTINISNYKKQISVIRSVYALENILILCTRGANQVIIIDYSGKIITNISSESKTGYNWNHPVKICSDGGEGLLIVDKENDRVVNLSNDYSVKTHFGVYK